MLIINESSSSLNYEIMSSGTLVVNEQGQIAGNGKLSFNLPEGLYWVTLANVYSKPNCVLGFGPDLTSDAVVSIGVKNS